jgi:hypothetical protein
MILVHVNGTEFTKQQEKLVSKIAADCYGKFDGVSDKGVYFQFDTQATADGFRKELRQHRIFADET